MKRISLLVVFSLLSGFVLSQSLIKVQDVSHCGFGLKDEEGKWVVPAYYTILEPTADPDRAITSTFNGWKISTDGYHYGLLDSAGKEVFAPYYKEVRIEPYQPVKNIFEPAPPPHIVDSVILISRTVDYFEINPTFLRYDCHSGQGFGLADPTGKLLTPPRYYYIEWGATRGHVVVSDWNGPKRLFGVVDSTGKEVVPVEYEHVSSPMNGGVYVSNAQRTGFISWKDGVFHPMKMECAEWYARSYKFGESSSGTIDGTWNGKFGLMDEYGNVIVPAVYDTLYGWAPNKMRPFRKNGKSGLIDKNGKELLAGCDSIEPFVINYEHAVGGRYLLKSHNVFFIRNGKYGVFNDSLGVVVKPEFSLGGWVADSANVFWGKKGDRVVLIPVIGKKNKTMKPAAVFPKEETFTLESEFHTLTVAPDGTILRDERFMRTGVFEANDELSHTEGPRGVGVYSNVLDSAIVPAIYRNAENVVHYSYGGYGNDGYLYVKTFSGHYGVYDPEGNKLVDTLYETVSEFYSAAHCWIAWSADRAAWTVIGENGEKLGESSDVLPEIDFGYSRLVVRQNGHDVILDTDSGKVIYNDDATKEIYPLSNGYFMVENAQGKFGLINSDCEPVLPFVYDHISDPVNGYFIVVNENGAGIMGEYGDTVLLPTRKSWVHLPLALDSIFEPGMLPPDADDFNVRLDAHYETSPGTDEAPARMQQIAANYLLRGLLFGYFGASSYGEPDPNFALVELTDDDDDYVYDSDYESYSTQSDYSIEAVTRVSFCIRHYTSEGGHYGFSDNCEMTNYIAQGDSVYMVQLYDVLDENRNYQPLNDTVRARIATQAEDNFVFNCGNPESLAPDYFIITAEGIRLFYVSTYEYESDMGYGVPLDEKMLSVLLTWKELGPYVQKTSPVRKLVISH